MEKFSYILGNPRSGTSLLRLMLTCHHDITVPPECGFLVWMEENWTDCKEYTCGAIESFVDELMSTKKFETWNLTRPELVDYISQSKPKSYVSLCVSVYRLYASKMGKNPKVIGDKNNYYIHHISTLRKLHKDAVFIHIMRDPRDVYCSYRDAMLLKSTSPYKPSLPTTIEDFCDSWINNIVEVKEKFKDAPSEMYYELAFEDLVRNPEKVLAEICHWLGVTYDSEMLNYYKINRGINLEPSETIDWKKKTLEPLDIDVVGRYMSQLQQDEIKYINYRCYDLYKSLSIDRQAELDKKTRK